MSMLSRLELYVGQGEGMAGRGYGCLYIPVPGMSWIGADLGMTLDETAKLVRGLVLGRGHCRLWNGLVEAISVSEGEPPVVLRALSPGDIEELVWKVGFEPEVMQKFRKYFDGF